MIDCSDDNCLFNFYIGIKKYKKFEKGFDEEIKNKKMKGIR